MSKTYVADAVVVGGGPAGMTAARDLARLGLDVALVDENERLGGQYFKPRSESIIQKFGEHRPAGTRLASEVLESGVKVLASSLIWGVETSSRTLLAETKQGFSRLQSNGIILATGARERSIPFPGWHLPGVMTAGCALHLAAVDCVRPGQRMVVGGSGPFLLPVVCSLLDAGVEVVEMYESARPYWPSRAALGMWRHPASMIELAGYLRKLSVAGVRIRQGTRILKAHADQETGRVGGVTVQGPNGIREVHSIDAAAVSFGFQPNTELAELFGCHSVIDPKTWNRVVATDSFGRSSIPGVLLAGEVAGIAGAKNAAVEGSLAAFALAQDLGKIPKTSSPPRKTVALHRELAHFTQIAQAQFPVQTSVAREIPAETMVCRCEGTSARDVIACASQKPADLNGVKGYTRAGMGICQGRQCGFAVAELVHRSSGVSDTPSLFTTRMPIKPIALDDACESRCSS